MRDIKRATAFLLCICIMISFTCGMNAYGEAASKDASSNASFDASSEATSEASTTESSTTAVEVTTEASSDATTKEPATEAKPSIKWKTKTESIKAGKSFTFKAVAIGTGSDITYSVSNTNVAAIGETSGKLKAKKAGKITVTAKAGSLSVDVKVTVKAKKIICLDPGHSGSVAKGTEPIGPGSKTMKAKDNSGTAGNYTHVPEYKLTLTVAKKLRTMLISRGYKVVMTRNDNKKAISCVERAKVANKAKADAYLRIHADSITSSAVRGMSMHYASKSNPYVGKKYGAANKKLSAAIKKGFVKATGSKVRGGGLNARNDLTGNNWAKVPTTLIEMGFMSNPTEDKMMQTASYQKKMVKGMADGFDIFFGYK